MSIYRRTPLICEPPGSRSTNLITQACPGSRSLNWCPVIGLVPTHNWFPVVKFNHSDLPGSRSSGLWSCLIAIRFMNWFPLIRFTDAQLPGPR